MPDEKKTPPPETEEKTGQEEQKKHRNNIAKSPVEVDRAFRNRCGNIII